MTATHTSCEVRPAYASGSQRGGSVDDDLESGSESRA